MHQKRLAAGLPDPLGELTALPQRSPDLAGYKSGGRDKGRMKGKDRRG